MENPKGLPDIRIITISGRIASGATTLAKHLAQTLKWKHVEGGDVFWEEVRKKMELSPKDTHLRPDTEDKIFDEQLIKTLKEEKQIVLETKLAAFNAQGITGVFKILAVCDDKNEGDQTDVRVDRLVNREGVTVEEAKKEILEREKNDLEKWRRMYAKDDHSWVYWDKKYYDLVVNTFNHSPEETLEIALKGIGYKSA
ncbi:MAG: cytidylate kinase family protein [Candidatus Levyibacteriota bacterium]